MKKEEAVVFLAWGEEFIQEVESCIKRSKAILGYDLILITDEETDLENLQCSFTEVVRAPFETQGLLRKTEMFEFLPDTYDTYLFLDSDTVVIEDISFGFKKADEFSIAIAPAPHYSLDYFLKFDKIMELEGVPCKGQLQYNTGVIFFKRSQVVQSVFEQWMLLAVKYQKDFINDQPFFTLAMEALNFNPYTLSISYNYRGFGDAISGIVRIWHSHGTLPEKINERATAWPLRKAFPSKVVFSKRPTGPVSRLRSKIKKLTRHWM